MGNDFPMDAFNRLAEKMSDFIDVQIYNMETEPDTRSNRKKDRKPSNNNGFTRVMTDRLRDMNSNINGLTRAVEDLTRITNEQKPMATQQSVSNIENTTNNIENNTEVLWEESAESVRRQEANFNMLGGLLKEIRNPLETIAYRLSGNMFRYPVESLTPKEKPSASVQPEEPQIVRLDTDQVALLETGIVQLDVISNLLNSNLKQANANANKLNSSLSKMYTWFLRNGQYQRRNDRDENRNQKKQSAFQRLIFGNMNKTLGAMKGSLVDLNSLMALRNIASTIGIGVGGVAKGGKILGGAAASFMVGDYIKNMFNTILDGVQANSPTVVSNILAETTDWISNLMDDTFGSMSGLIESLIVGAGALKGTSALVKGITSLAKRLLPSIMTAVGAIVTAPEFLALMASAGLITIAKTYKDEIASTIDNAMSKVSNTVKEGVQHIEDLTGLSLEQKPEDSTFTPNTELDESAKKVLKAYYQAHKEQIDKNATGAELSPETRSKLIDDVQALVDVMDKTGGTQALQGMLASNMKYNPAEFSNFIVKSVDTGKQLGGANNEVEKEQRSRTISRDATPQYNVNSSNVNNSNTTIQARSIEPNGNSRMPSKTGTGLYE